MKVKFHLKIKYSKGQYDKALMKFWLSILVSVHFSQTAFTKIVGSRKFLKIRLSEKKIK